MCLGARRDAGIMSRLSLGWKLAKPFREYRVLAREAGTFEMPRGGSHQCEARQDPRLVLVTHVPRTKEQPGLCATARMGTQSPSWQLPRPAALSPPPREGFLQAEHFWGIPRRRHGSWSVCVALKSWNSEVGRMGLFGSEGARL